MRSEIKVHDRLRVLYADATDEFFRNVVQKSGHNCKPKPKEKPKV